MHVFPKSRGEWVGSILFPFKAYTVLALIAVFIWGSALPRSQSSAVMDAGMLVVAGHLVSGVVLLIGGVVQSYIGPRRSRLSSYVFGVIAIIIAFSLAPMLAAA